MDDADDFADQVEADLGMHDAERAAHKVEAHLVAGKFYAEVELAWEWFTQCNGPLESLDHVERAMGAIVDCLHEAELCECSVTDLLVNLMFRSFVQDGSIRLTPECLAELQAVDDATEESARAWAYQRLTGE